MSNRDESDMIEQPIEEQASQAEELPSQDAVAEASSADESEEATESPRRRMRWWQKLLVGFGSLVGLLVVLAAVLYFFGGMSGSVYDPQIEQQYQQLRDAGQAPAIQSEFVVPIPGCQCHSSDPVLTQQHRARRMYMCAKCHSKAGS